SREENHMPACALCPATVPDPPVARLLPAYAKRTGWSCLDLRRVEFSEISGSRRRLSDPDCASVHRAEARWDGGSSPAPGPDDAPGQWREFGLGSQRMCPSPSVRSILRDAGSLPRPTD